MLRPTHLPRGVCILVALALGGACLSCSSAEPGPGKAPPVQHEVTTVPFPTTVELNVSDLSSLQPDPGDGTLSLHFAAGLAGQRRAGAVSSSRG